MRHIYLQNVSTCPTIPQSIQIEQWVNAVLDKEITQAEITVRVVDKPESAALNEHYRKKTGPTNVLSFPLEQNPLMGDLVICAPLVLEEATEQGKMAEAHWAHLIIHGTLHLLGYDHQIAHEAEVMEAKEIAILEELGYHNPYLDL